MDFFSFLLISLIVFIIIKTIYNIFSFRKLKFNNRVFFETYFFNNTYNTIVEFSKFGYSDIYIKYLPRNTNTQIIFIDPNLHYPSGYSELIYNDLIYIVYEKKIWLKKNLIDAKDNDINQFVLTLGNKIIGTSSFVEPDMLFSDYLFKIEDKEYLVKSRSAYIFFGSCYYDIYYENIIIARCYNSFIYFKNNIFPLHFLFIQQVLKHHSDWYDFHSGGDA